MRVLKTAVAALVIAVSLSACGGDDKKVATSSTTATPRTLPIIPMTLPDDPADVRRANALAPTPAELTAAANATNPNRADKLPAESTEYAGNPDIRAERDQCDVGSTRGPQDTAFIEGPPVLIVDPITDKTLAVSSHVAVSVGEEARSPKIAHLRDPATIACMHSVLKRRVDAERAKRNVTPEKLRASQSIEPLNLPGLGSNTVAFRFHIQVTLDGSQPVDQWMDLLITYVGRAAIAIAVEGQQTAPSTEFDVRIIDRVRSNAVKVMAAP